MLRVGHIPPIAHSSPAFERLAYATVADQYMAIFGGHADTRFRIMLLSR